MKFYFLIHLYYFKIVKQNKRGKGNIHERRLAHKLVIFPSVRFVEQLVLKSEKSLTFTPGLMCSLVHGRVSLRFKGQNVPDCCLIFNFDLGCVFEFSPLSCSILSFLTHYPDHISTDIQHDFFLSSVCLISPDGRPNICDGHQERLWNIFCRLFIRVAEVIVIAACVTVGVDWCSQCAPSDGFFSRSI